MDRHFAAVLNPGEETLDAVWKLLIEAHELAARKYANQQTRRVADAGIDLWAPSSEA